MSKNSLILVLQNKQENSTIDMAKIHIKSEKLTPFGGIFHVRELFSRFVAPTTAHPRLFVPVSIPSILFFITKGFCY
jgi:hypothetical protein